MRIKRPDYKDAESLLEAARRDIKYTLSLNVTLDSTPTIIRNVYESFRMLGDALLISRGIESSDHVQPIQEILKLNLNTKRPLQVIDNLRRLRHNINYYGYSPTVEEAEDVLSIARSCFEEVYRSVMEFVKRGR